MFAKLPRRLTLDLPEMDFPKMQAQFKKATMKLVKLSRDVPLAGSRFKKRCHELSIYAQRGEVARHLERFIDIRVVVHLWANNKIFREAHPPSSAFFKAFNDIAPHASRLSLQAMVALFFDKYDLLGEKGLTEFRSYLAKQVDQSNARKPPLSLKAFATSAKTLLTPTAPQDLCKYAIDNNRPLDVVLEQMGVPRGKENRFNFVCQNIYYIHTLEQLQLGQDSPVFAELVKPINARMPHEGAMLGHAVIKILIDKCMEAKEALPTNWRDIILEIASDPRVPVGSTIFRQWWNEIGQKRTLWMIQWLSQLDLKIFFEVLKEYADNSGKEDLQRMFPARERFLLGLYDLGLIKGSRLFLGYQASSFLKSRIEKKALPHYAELSDGNKAIIYLDLGKVHMVEGTHSFPLLLFDKLPPESNILSYDKKYFPIDSLNKKLILRHEIMLMRGDANIVHSRIVHSPTTWQAKALSYLKKYGLDIHPSRVLDRDSYNIYRSK